MTELQSLIGGCCEQCRSVVALIAVALAEHETIRRKQITARLNELRTAGVRLGRPKEYDWLVGVRRSGSIREQAKALGVTPSTLHRWTRPTRYRPRLVIPEDLHHLPVKDLARRYGVHTSSIYRVLQAQRVAMNAVP